MKVCTVATMGYYCPETGMTTPDKCSTDFGSAYTSHAGADTCDVCVSTYYMDLDERCVEKPEGVKDDDDTEGVRRYSSRCTERRLPPTTQSTPSSPLRQSSPSRLSTPLDHPRHHERRAGLLSLYLNEQTRLQMSAHSKLCRLVEERNGWE